MSLIESDDPVAVAARSLLSAAHAFWEAKRKANGGAAVVWLEDSDGRVIIFTRGEYRDILMGAVAARGDAVQFFAVPESTEGGG